MDLILTRNLKGIKANNTEVILQVKNQEEVLDEVKAIFLGPVYD